MENTHEHSGNLNQIRADRACVGCGFNLFGQTVIKEEHYNLAITRCPECGTVAALQSYPTMSHWVNRFRMILASVWIVILIALFAAHTGGMIGFTVSAVDIASNEFENVIGLAHEQWQVHQTAPTPLTKTQAPIPAPNTPTPFPGATTIISANGVTTINGVVVGQSSYRWQQVSDEWVDTQLETTIIQTGGLWKNINKQFLYLVFPAAVVSTIAGVIWSIVLLGAKRKQVLLIPLTGCIIAGFMVWGVNNSMGSSPYTSQIAESLYTLRVMLIMLGIQFVFLSFGVFIGRKIARMFVIMALPARIRVPFSIFWTRDGLAPPRP